MNEFNSIFKLELEAYLSIRESILSVSAAKHERCYLKRFDEYLLLVSRDRVPEINEELMNNWLSSLKGKSSSIENEVIVVRQFLRYLAKTGVPVFAPAVPKVRDDYVPYIFSDNELELIFHSADNITLQYAQPNKLLVIIFPTILRLMFSCGLRIGETCELQMKDVDLENGILHMKHTKGNKHRLVPMSTTMTEILREYCLVLGIIAQPDAWLFPSVDRQSPISQKTIKNRFDVILRDNEIRLKNRKKHERGPCLHCLRHVFAFKSFSQAQQIGVTLDDSIPYLSIYLGHERLNETSKYLKFSSILYPRSVTDFGDFIQDLLPEVNYEIE